MLKFVHKRQPTRAVLVGEFAKGPDRRDHNPEWMEARVFDGSTWLELKVHERKYLLRKIYSDLIKRGALRRESVPSNYTPQPFNKLVVGTVLDILAALDD